MIILFSLLLIPSILLETTVTTIPFIFVFLFLLLVITRQGFVFLLAFFSGIFIDVLSLRPVGETSAYLLCFLFLVLLYRRKYEIYSFPFVVISSFAGSSLYLLFFGGDTILLQGLICAVLSFVLFTIITITHRQAV